MFKTLVSSILVASVAAESPGNHSLQNNKPKFLSSDGEMHVYGHDVVFHIDDGMVGLSEMHASVDSLPDTITTAIDEVDGQIEQLTGALDKSISDTENKLTSLTQQVQQDKTDASNALGSVSDDLKATKEKLTSAENTVKAQADQLKKLEDRIKKLEPKIPTSKPKSCKEIIDRNPKAKSGSYEIQPPGISKAFKVYCDHESFGGGWTLVWKLFAGDYRWMSGTKYLEMMANPKEDVFTNVLLDDQWYVKSGRGDRNKRSGSFSQAKTNAIARATIDEGLDPVVRIDHKWNPDRWNIANYLQQRKNATKTFDYWSALRDSSVWTNKVNRGWRIPHGLSEPKNGFGTTFIAAKDPGSFDSERNSFEHNTCGDIDFGVWGIQTHTVKGAKVRVSKHGGVLCDGVCHRGNQWAVTLHSNDGRFRNDDDRRSLIYIR